MRTANLLLPIASFLTFSVPALAETPLLASSKTAAQPVSDSSNGSDTTSDSSDEAPKKSTHGAEAKTATASADDEIPSQKYMYVGLKYGGDVIPAFLLGAFVDNAKTIYSNSISIEMDLHKDGFSLIPALTYTDYSTGDMLLHQKGKGYEDYNWSMIKSQMKAIYAGVDLKWAVPVAHQVEFEYGAGFGLGFVFGNLYDDWVAAPPFTGGSVTTNGSGVVNGTNGVVLAACPTAMQNTGNGCDPQAHTTQVPNKVGNYTDKSWFNGGPKPSLLPSISVQALGLRFRPAKEFEARIGAGTPLTGLWFSLSADYGLPADAGGAKSARSSSQVSGISF